MWLGFISSIDIIIIIIITTLQRTGYIICASSKSALKNSCKH